ncbi:MAG: D-Ala-D-Ala carboxypeptidase family metallohydrolase [Phenylobacterium sp.]|uniref:D-Ala-D-Ala carboxypeptidase family metallohydrolase n=1 Tax=Phenylobacterium sp. TaxID=1871053 RepID=UPI00391BACC5
MSRLSPHFSLEELTASQTAARKGIDNTPPPAVIEALRKTAAQLEAVRELLGGRVITVSSGYRSPRLNRAVGGTRASAHLKGRAVDFNCYGFGSPLAVCRAIASSEIPFDQLIEEGTWVHLSFDERLRRQVRTKAPGGGYRPGLRSD